MFTTAFSQHISNDCNRDHAQKYGIPLLYTTFNSTVDKGALAAAILRKLWIGTGLTALRMVSLGLRHAQCRMEGTVRSAPLHLLRWKQIIFQKSTQSDQSSIVNPFHTNLVVQSQLRTHRTVLCACWFGGRIYSGKLNWCTSSKLLKGYKFWIQSMGGFSINIYVF